MVVVLCAATFCFVVVEGERRLGVEIEGERGEDRGVIGRQICSAFCRGELKFPNENSQLFHALQAVGMGLGVAANRKQHLYVLKYAH